MKTYILLLVMIVFTFSCTQKELPPLLDEAPVFTIEAMIGNDTVLYEAGNNGMYMNTDVYKNQFGLFVLKGIMGKQDCDTCEPSISVEINANTLSGTNYIYNPSIFSANSYLNSFSLDTISGSGTNSVLACNPQNTSIGTTYFWQHSSGATSTSPNPTFNLIPNSLNQIKMITMFNGMQDSITQSIKINGASSSIIDSFVASYDSSQSLLNCYVSTNKNKHYYNWGDGNTEVIYNGPATHSYSQNLNYSISVICVDTIALDTTTFVKRINLTNQANVTFLPSFSFNVNATSVVKQNLNTCIIKVRKNGKVYTSYNPNSTLNQSNQSVLKINQAVPGEINPQGKKTMVFDAQADLYLHNQLNYSDSIRFRTTKMVMAVAVPN